MPVGIGIKFPKGDQEQYDKLIENMGVQDEPPEGLVFHCAGPLDEGWSVMDVWESREQFDKFMEERVQPAAEEAGVEGLNDAETTEFEVHNVIKP
jgi:hypothetical protein